jgi:enediyne biosynthesis thioesterase
MDGGVRMKTYEHRHIVGFEETNLVGNVYYANHIRWQGKCREMFLKEHAPAILDELARDLCMVTLHTSCEYFDQLFAFDEVIVRMRLGEIVQNRIQMLFDYVRVKDGKEKVVAKGEQAIACMRRKGDTVAACPIPETLREAMRPYESV